MIEALVCLLYRFTGSEGAACPAFPENPEDGDETALSTNSNGAAISYVLRGRDAGAGLATRRQSPARREAERRCPTDRRSSKGPSYRFSQWSLSHSSRAEWNFFKRLLLGRGRIAGATIPTDR